MLGSWHSNLDMADSVDWQRSSVADPRMQQCGVGTEHVSQVLRSDNTVCHDVQRQGDTPRSHCAAAVKSCSRMRRVPLRRRGSWAPGPTAA